MPREEVLGVEQVQVPIGVKVMALKHHLRLLMPDLLPPAPTDLVLVMYHYSNTRFPTFFHLSDDQLHMTDLLDTSTYNKVIHDFIVLILKLSTFDKEDNFKCLFLPTFDIDLGCVNSAKIILEE